MRLMLKGALVLALIVVFATSAMAEITVMNKGTEEISVSGQVQFGGIIQENDEGGTKFNDTFKLRRARLGVRGDLPGNFSFWILGEFAPGMVAGKDIFVKWTDEPGRFWIRGGHMKVPYSYEFNTSSTRLYTIDYSMPTLKLAPGYETGAEMGGVFGVEDAVSWSLGVYNGNGAFTKSDTNDPALVAANLSWGDEDEVLIGVNTFKDVSGGGSSGLMRERYTGLGAYGASRFGPTDNWLCRAEYMWIEIEDDVTDAEFDTQGWWALLGYYFDDTYMGVLKGEQYDPGSGGDDKITQYTVGLNWFVMGRGAQEHQEKFQLEYVYTDEEGTDIDNNRIQAQMQLLF